ncbi:MAG: hypothetical protein ACMG51_09635 [Ginsengibacter sp.]
METHHYYFWRIIIIENGKNFASAEGKADTAKLAAKMIWFSLEEFYLHKFPKDDGNSVEIKTILEKVEGFTDDAQQKAYLNKD